MGFTFLTGTGVWIGRSLSYRNFGVAPVVMGVPPHSAADLARVLESAPDGLLVISEDDAIVDANQRALDILGFAREELLGKSCDSLVPERFRAGHAEKRRSWHDAPVARNMGGVPAPRALRKDGTEIGLEIALRELPAVGGKRRVACWFREEGGPAAQSRQLKTLYGVARIIAAAPGLDEAAPPILREICETLGWSVGLLWTATTDGGELRLVHSWSPDDPRLQPFIAHCRARAFTPEEGVIGIAWSRRSPAWIPELESERSFVRLPAARAAGLRSMVVVPILFAGRLLGAMEMYSAIPREPEPELLPLLSGLGSILGEFIDRIRVVEGLRLREERLRQSEKMEAIGRLAGGIAHDFNNMLTAILGFSEELLERLGPDSPCRADLEQIHRAGERSADLTRQLLAFGRRQMLQPRVIDLNATIAGMEPMLRRLLGEKVRLEVLPAAEMCCVKVDPGQFEQVALNLALNGRDAMRGGGTLVIETANLNLDEAYARRHPGVVPGPFVMFSVSDTGTGMDEETRSHLFEPFFTTKVRGQGTGLGLATIHGIVNQSGGHIWVYSELGRGTSFKVYLPRVFEKPHKSEPPAPRPVRGDETILVIEDEEVVRLMVKSILEQQGYRVLMAGCAAEALQTAQEHGPDLHLVLSDVVLPDGNARRLSERIRELAPKARYLFMSGYTSNAIFHNGVLDPGVEFIEKPFAPHDLLVRLRRLLDSPA